MKTNISDDRVLFKQHIYGNFSIVNAEIHITYAINSDDELFKFKEACLNHDIKVVAIDLLNGESLHIMTSERLRSPLHDIHHAIKSTLNDLWEFHATRIKVELDNSCIDSSIHHLVEYYESHINCDISTLEKYNILSKFLINHDYKLSRSAKDDDSVISITKRYLIDNDDIVNEYNYLAEQGIAQSKLEIECIIFDSNLDLDANW